MKFVRSHQSFIAWMLYGFILFSGLVCSLSHGQMLRAFNQATPDIDCRAQDALSGHRDMANMDMNMAKMSDHALLMKLSMTDCAFAATLALAMVFYIGLAWLARAARRLIPRSDYLLRRPPRQMFPGQSPQAP